MFLKNKYTFCSFIYIWINLFYLHSKNSLWVFFKDSIWEISESISIIKDLDYSEISSFFFIYSKTKLNPSGYSESLNQSVNLRDQTGFNLETTVLNLALKDV